MTDEVLDWGIVLIVCFSKKYLSMILVFKDGDGAKVDFPDEANWDRMVIEAKANLKADQVKYE